MSAQPRARLIAAWRSLQCARTAGVPCAVEEGLCRVLHGAAEDALRSVDRLGALTAVDIRNDRVRALQTATVEA